MKKIVIMPGGFHPFHAGHMALYNSAKEHFPDADVYVAATDSREERPFPFAVKEKLAKVAGVDPSRFIQVKSPFKANEITDHYDPDKDVLIFVRSEKDKTEQPKPGGTKKDGTPAYFQPYSPDNLEPFKKHAYIEYLPTVTFGPGIKSATEIRNAWPKLNDKRKLAMVMSLYPITQKNSKLAKNVSDIFDQVIGGKVTENRAAQQMALYNPDGKTYRGKKMPTLDDPDDIYTRSKAYNIDDMSDEPVDEPNVDYSIKKLIKGKLGELTQKERKLLQLRYWHDMTIDDIARTVGVSAERIRQIEAKALRKLRDSSQDSTTNAMKMYVPESLDYLEEK